MSRARRWLARGLSAALTAGIVALTVVLWPASLGGATTWITVTGASMEPTYHLGDLVLARSGGDHDVGDVVVFAVPEGTAAGSLVIHRIVDRRDDGSWVTQGDNRDTADQWRVHDEHVVGRPVLQLPRAGRLAGSGTPVAAILGLAVALWLWPRRDDPAPPPPPAPSGTERIRATYLPRVTDAELRAAELWVESELIDAKLRDWLESASTETPASTTSAPPRVIAAPGSALTRPSPGPTSTTVDTAAACTPPNPPPTSTGHRRRHHEATMATASANGISGQRAITHHDQPVPATPRRSAIPSNS